MPVFVALLRAVNVGGTGKLAMADLVRLCERTGFTNVRTYIQSGNVVLSASATETEVKAALETALAEKLGRPVGVLVRQAAELERVLAANPFPTASPSQVIVMFFDQVLPGSAVATVASPDGEQLVLNGRELFIHYPNGQGRSKLKVPSAKMATGRNLRTVSKLAAMTKELARGAG